MANTCNYACVMNDGRYKIELNDGTVYSFKWPNFEVTSILKIGCVNMIGTIEIWDEKNKICCEVNFP